LTQFKARAFFNNNNFTKTSSYLVSCYLYQDLIVGYFLLTYFPLRVCPIFQILTSSDDGDEKAITAMGVLNTLETILTVMENNEEVHSQLEPVILQVMNQERED
jgi:hypothetical protein